MQEDIYQGDGLNLYAYCGNNPVMYSDPSGYAKKQCSTDNTSTGALTQEEMDKMIIFEGDTVHPGTVTPNNPDGIYTIKATGDYFDDRKVLAQAAGIDLPNASEWRAHHIDYDPTTNTMRMQFVSTIYHSYPHFGGAGAFQRFTGFEYGSLDAIKWAQGKNAQY